MKDTPGPTSTASNKNPRESGAASWERKPKPKLKKIIVERTSIFREAGTETEQNSDSLPEPPKP